MLLVRSDKVSGPAQRINKSRLAGTAYTDDRDQFIHKANYKTVYSALSGGQSSFAPQSKRVKPENKVFQLSALRLHHLGGFVVSPSHSIL